MAQSEDGLATWFENGVVVHDIGEHNNWATIQVGTEIFTVTLKVGLEGLATCNSDRLTEKQMLFVEKEVNVEPMHPTTEDDPCGNMRRTAMSEHQFYERLKEIVVDSWALSDEDPVSREEVFENVCGWYKRMRNLERDLLNNPALAARRNHKTKIILKDIIVIDVSEDETSATVNIHGKTVEVLFARGRDGLMSVTECPVPLTSAERDLIEEKITMFGWEN